MRLTYSYGAKFAGGGTGAIAYQEACSLYRAGVLERLLCGSYAPTEIPAAVIRAHGLPSRGLRKLATYDRSRWLWYLQCLHFDGWASRRIEQTDLFYAWSGFAQRSVQRARALGAVTVVEHASTHPVVQYRVLQEEYARWGQPFRTPKANVERIAAEIEQADYVRIPSSFVAQSFAAEGVPQSKLLEIPFGVDATRFRPSDDHPPHPFRALFVGQVGFRKGIPDLLEAWRRLGWRDAELWLVGRVEPGFQPVLDAWKDTPGTRRVGYAPDPVALYQEADVFVFPTIEEGSALVTYEALACGLPVLTTPNAGSVVRHGVDGLLTPIRDVEALAYALEQLRADERLRRQMSLNARARAEAYTWERSGDQLVAALQRVAAHEPAADWQDGQARG